ncbi:MAG: FAD-dependent oxidoreductase [Balneola sp.]
MKKYDYDVIILGSGPAGFSCAMQSSKFDKKVLVIEANQEHLGGAWINSGTVPSKALRETSRIIQRYQNQFPEEAKEKPYSKYLMGDLLSYKDQILESKNKKVENDLIKNEVDTYRGYGSLVDKHTVEVKNWEGEKKKFTAEYIMLATGSHNKAPDGFKVDHEIVLDDNSVLSLTHIPRRMVIIGSGINALEYATTFSSLGTRITILSYTSEFLPFLDHDIRSELNKVLADNSIEIIEKVRDLSIGVNDLRGTVEVMHTLKDDNEKGRKYVLETEHVLYLGKKLPNTDGIKLDKVGVELDDEGFIKTDGTFRSSVENIFATGDVAGFPRLASASFSQGRIASCEMFREDNTLEMPEQIPFAIYSIPEISNIGLTQQEAIDNSFNVAVGRAYYKNITQGDVSNQQTGLLKIVFDQETFKILGIHIIGERASDLIHLGQSVMNLGGDIRYFIDHVLNYPTYSEAYRIAAFNGINFVHKAGVKYKKILK